MVVLNFKSNLKKFVDASIVLTLEVIIDSTKRLNSPIERVHRSLKELFVKKKEVYNGKVPRDIKTFFKEIVDVYNNRVHSTIQDTPNNVFMNKNGAHQKVKEIYQQKIYNSIPNPDNPLPIGTKVRVYVPPKKFSKTGIYWSKKIYVIDANSYKDDINRYKIAGKLYDREHLNIVKNDDVESFTVPRQRINTIPRNNNNEEENNERSKRTRRRPQKLDL